MAIAYFQQGVSNFLLGDFEEALANFNDTLLYLRGNRWIDYDQLGLKFKLHSCEALFNRGLCYIYLQQRSAGLQDMFYASKEKAVPDHDVIDEAIREQAEVSLRVEERCSAHLTVFRAILCFQYQWVYCTDQTRRKSRTSSPRTISGPRPWFGLKIGLNMFILITDAI
jgi:tetratricopeptide (TPR) repeat protein